MVLTIENLPDDVIRALRERASAENKSVCTVAVDALARGLGVQQLSTVQRRDLTGIAGLGLITDEMKAAFKEQRQIDPELWK